MPYFPPIGDASTSINSSTNGRVAIMDGTTGKLLKEGTKLEVDLVTGPGSATSGDIPTFSGTTGKVLASSTVPVVDVLLKSTDFGIAGSDVSGSSNSGLRVRALRSATTSIDIESAAAPSAGQVLTATGPTSATWQNATGSGDPHRTTHQDGGADEINVTGLSGLLADPQTAGGLKSATTIVSVSSAAAPSAGEALIATSATTAAWQAPWVTLGGATTDISVNNQKITNLGSPTAANDAANKAYVDITAQGLTVKEACRLLATANITLSGLSSIDGVTPAAGNRILVAGQTTASTNGIYVAASGAWSRAPDADVSAEVMAGMYTFVTEGSVYGDTGWILATDNPITLGTTPLTFAQFSSVGTVVAGDGLSRTGNTFAVGANADGSIAVSADDIRVGVLATDAQHGNRGGGALHAVADSGNAGFLSSADWTKFNGAAPGSRTITAGTGLTGGGDLSADRTLSADFGTTSGKVMQGNQAAGGDASGTLNSLTVTQARGLKSATTTVSVSAATAPSTGQVLTATSSTTATWQNPSGGVPTTRTISAGTGLTGGGDLTADRSLAADFGTASGKVMQGNQAAGGDASGTLDNLTITQARGLKSATTTVSVSAATAPSTGQVLTATGSSTATWQNVLPAGTNATVGRLTVDAILETPTAVAYSSSVSCDTSIKNDFTIGTLTGPITINLTNPANGRQGFVAVRQDATGNRGVTLSVSGYTNYRDAGTPDLVAAPAANAVTVYAYALIVVGGLSMALWSKVLPVSA